MRKHSKSRLSRRAILSTLRRNRAVLQRYAVRRAALFGSYARGGATTKSDIDLLIDFEAPTYDNYVGLVRELEQIFGRKIEVLTPRGLDSIRVKGIAESIRKSLAYV